MSKKLKLTPWFPGDVKPVRQGVYQQHSGLDRRIGYQRWNGRQWYSWSDTPKGAASSVVIPAAACFQNDEWRGLAVKP